MPRPSRREALLDAAIAVIRRDGAQKLTLDAVAAESGISKGGVLYHFATKRALVDGLLERWLDDFDRRLEASDDVLAEYIRCSDLSDADPDVAATEFGMLAGMIDDPQVLAAVRAFQERWMARMLAGGIDPADAWTVRLAADGLWYADLLGLAAPRGDDRRALLARLLTLARGDNR
jgi:AcrR family transcriptional regulator